MQDRDWQIACSGTFDVENYGDLLFPLIAEAELAERLGTVKLHRFSYLARTTPEWPYEVTSLAELPRLAGGLDGFLIGGGFIIRFDKYVAPAYGPPTPAIHHPTGYWLTPALIALQYGIPLVWNAPGMHCNDIPAWAEPLMELAFTNSAHVAVRDEPSRQALARFAGNGRIAVTPDTGFGVSRLLDGRRPSAEFESLRERAGLTGPYVVVQAIPTLESFWSFVRKHSDLLRDFRFLVLPIGPVHGERGAVVSCDVPGLVRLPDWPPPLVLAELISRSAAVVGQSYHLLVTALACGVPAFNSADLSVGKYTALSGFETIHPLPKAESDPYEFLARLGRKAPAATARAALDELARHWDRTAAILRRGRTSTQPALNRFWQSLPTLLEDAAREPEELNRLLAAARAEIAARDDRIAALYDSTSWKVTAPLRALARGLKRLAGQAGGG